MTNAEAWDYAIGMIKVDGLEPTAAFKEYIEKEKRGEITMDDALGILMDYHYGGEQLGKVCGVDYMVLKSR